MAAATATVIRRPPPRTAIVAARPQQRTRTVIVQQGAAIARRAGSAIARQAAEEKHTLFAVGASLAVGWADSRNMLDSVPTLIPGTGPVGTLALVAWGLGKFTGSRMARHTATGLASVAAFRIGAGQTE